MCDCEGAELACTGHCISCFYLNCLGLVEEPSFKFLYDECLISSGTCFACGKGDGQVRKCGGPKCPKLYHQECVQGNKLFQIGKSSSFTCPLHVCARCVSIGVSSIEHSTQLLQYVRCPLALHKPDCLVAGCEVIGPTQMICYKHVKILRTLNSILTSISTPIWSAVLLAPCIAAMSAQLPTMQSVWSLILGQPTILEVPQLCCAGQSLESGGWCSSNSVVVIRSKVITLLADLSTLTIW